jgi:type IV secretory pathway TrbL component
MMAGEEKHVVAETVETVTADTAALAANNAERAAAAAQDAIVHAETAAAEVAHQAAETIRGTTEGLSEWQTSIQAQNAELAENLRAHIAQTDQRLRETTERLTSIHERLPPPPPPPQSQSPAPSGETPPRQPEGSSTGSLAEPPKEPAPERKRAHRWI